MSGFPFLRLPQVPRKKIAGHWTPITLYNFSKVSQKTKEVASSLSRTPLEIRLICGESGRMFRIEIKYRNCVQKKAEVYVFEMDNLKGFVKRRKEEEGPLDKLINNENPSVGITKLAEDIQKIFKFSLSEIIIKSNFLNHNQLLDLYTWINSMKKETIPKMVFEAKNLEKLIFFLKDFNIPMENIDLRSYILPSELIKNPINFNGFRCDVIKVSWAFWIGLKQLNTLDFVEADFHNSLLTDKELNQFLKSWRDGISHLRMKKCIFQLDKICVRTILEDLCPASEIEGLEDSKRGVVKIQRKDRKRASIMFNKHEFPMILSIHLTSI